MTHDDLVKRAAKWLQQKHPVVITEMGSSCIEIPDAIGFRSGGWSTLIECKMSRGDYYADRKKGPFRMGDWRYYMTPKGLLTGLDITEGWGLLEVCGKVVRKVKEAPQHEEKEWRREQSLLLSCFRRIGKPKDPTVFVNYYTFTVGGRSSVKATLGVDSGVYAE